MESALRNRGKTPNSEYCRWDPGQLGEETFPSDDRGYEPTVKEPLVYHLHGRIDASRSLVLTERDYIEFVINLAKNPDLIPRVIRYALVTTSLLFIGYSLEDIDFRVIFQGILGRIKPPYQLPGISVQLEPIFSKKLREKALQYLNAYTRDMFKVSVYWGDATKFVEKLRMNLQGI